MFKGKYFHIDMQILRHAMAARCHLVCGCRMTFVQTLKNIEHLYEIYNIHFKHMIFKGFTIKEPMIEKFCKTIQNQERLSICMFILANSI
jgi:hypothetical protein